MDKLDQLEQQCKRVNDQLHRFVKQLNEAGFKGLKPIAADIDADALIELNEQYSISIPAITLRKAFVYILTERVSKGKWRQTEFKQLADLISAIKPKETNTMKNRTSTVIEPSLEKRQLEVAEVEQDIDAIEEALKTLEGGKHVYNAWIDFEDRATERKANTVLWEQFERVSTDVDALIEALQEQKKQYIEAKKGVERLVKVHAPKGEAKPTEFVKTPKSSTGKLNFSQFAEEVYGIDFRKLKAGTQEHKDIVAAFDDYTENWKQGDEAPAMETEKSTAKKPAAKAKAIPAKEAAKKLIEARKPNTPEMDADAIKATVASTNERAEEFAAYMKEEKQTVKEFVKATTKRPATVGLTRKRTVQFTLDGKATVTNGEFVKTYSARRFDYILKGIGVS